MSDEQETPASRFVLVVGRLAYIATLLLIALIVISLVASVWIGNWHWFPQPAD